MIDSSSVIVSWSSSTLSTSSCYINIIMYICINIEQAKKKCRMTTYNLAKFAQIKKVFSFLMGISFG